MSPGTPERRQIGLEDYQNLVDFAYIEIYLAIAIGVLILGIASPRIYEECKKALRQEFLREFKELRRTCPCAARTMIPV